MCFSKVQAVLGVKCCDECLTSMYMGTSINFASL